WAMLMSDHAETKRAKPSFNPTTSNIFPHPAVLVDHGNFPGDHHAPAGVRVYIGCGGIETGLGPLRFRVVAHQHGPWTGAQLAGLRRSPRLAGSRRGLGQPSRHQGRVGVVSGQGTRLCWGNL